jgi:DNA-directed RNA polymerase II subunit RPB1
MDIECVWSPNTLGIIDVYFNEKDITYEDKSVSFKECNRIHVYVTELLLPMINSIHLSGISGIHSIDYVHENTGEWRVDLVGTSENVGEGGQRKTTFKSVILREILALDIVDSIRTISNHMWEVYIVLGIEATREFLIQEFNKIISSESYINVRHIQLLVDIMLFTGTISSISRYGVHTNQSGVLTKCTFEESLDQMLKAGIYCETDPITGVSGSIICGKVSKIGTGLCDLVYNS